MLKRLPWLLIAVSLFAASCRKADDSAPQAAAPQAAAPQIITTLGGIEMAQIPAGRFLMGSDSPDTFIDDGEGPVREVRLPPYLIDTTAVTNAAFADFVAATGHVTDAEREGWSFVFHALLHPRNIRPLPLSKYNYVQNLLNFELRLKILNVPNIKTGHKQN